MLATADGFHEVEHAIGAVATDLEPRVTDGGMDCLVLSNLDTETGCTIVIKPWTEYVHSHDCLGIPGAVTLRAAKGDAKWPTH